MPNIYFPLLEMDHRNQSIFVAAYIEDNPFTNFIC